MDRVHVRNVMGHNTQGIFREENAETQVVEEARVIRVRIDDAEYPDAFLEIVLEIEG